MKRLRSLLVPILLSGALHAAAVEQKTVQATIRAASDRAPAPDFGLSDGSGTTRHLSDYRGRPVVVNLWATDCGGCKIELPSFVKLSQTYKDGGVSVLGVSMDIMYEGLKNAAEGLQVPHLTQRHMRQLGESSTGWQVYNLTQAIQVKIAKGAYF